MGGVSEDTVIYARSQLMTVYCIPGQVLHHLHAGLLQGIIHLLCTVDSEQSNFTFIQCGRQTL